MDSSLPHIISSLRQAETRPLSYESLKETVTSGAGAPHWRVGKARRRRPRPVPRNGGRNSQEGGSSRPPPMPSEFSVRYLDSRPEVVLELLRGSELAASPQFSPPTKMAPDLRRSPTASGPATDGRDLCDTPSPAAQVFPRRLDRGGGFSTVGHHDLAVPEQPDAPNPQKNPAVAASQRARETAPH